MFVINRCLSPALRKVFPTLYEAAPPVPQREPPPPPWWPYAVRPLPQRDWPLSGAIAAVLEVRVHKRQSGCRQGNVDNINDFLFKSFTNLSWKTNE